MLDKGFVDLIGFVTGVLNQAGVRHAVTGSIASGIHGEPVTSLDVDVVLIMSEAQAQQVAEAVSPRMYADVDTLKEASRRHAMANLIDTTTGLKVDLSVLSPTPYHEEVLKRRTLFSEPTTGLEFWVVSPEDIILMKLVWRKDSRSTKQWQNALSVVQVRGGQLDWAYLRGWARQLDVEADLDQLSREAGM